MTSAEDFTAQLKTVNESGFPLQIAVAYLVDSKRPGGWKVRYTEHAWSDQASGADGFIDVVLQNAQSTALMVVECKRVRDVEWIFLDTSDAPSELRDCKCWITRYKGDGFRFLGWNECPADPHSHQSAFCVVRGQAANGQRPMLERVASEVVSATEALAVQERDFRKRRPDGRFDDSFRAYLSVIVTTAPLLVGTLDPATVSLAEGTLPEAEFSRVPYVRFRKQLLQSTTPIQPTDCSPEDVAYAQESTVFVVNAEHLSDFLKEFELDEKAAKLFD